MTTPKAAPIRLVYSPAEAALLLGLSRAKVYGLMADGTLRSVKIGRARRIPHAALLELVGEVDL